ncbi:Uncharacterised protein [Chromobacterium violaceum]|uniref:Uncharacterized protein n=1 Tax=Chromobacterium violaceum TaxID=536 RepID=A0A447T703_CHRVL|nr:Uncharacterised protein [Chromobacterium violaceum]
MSGTTSAMPSSAASRCAPALWLKFSSVQVSPDSHSSHGSLPWSAAGGRNTLKRIRQQSVSESCSHCCWRPPKARLSAIFCNPFMPAPPRNG